MELRHLRYAVAVADARHITRAAERLGIQQPPLSQQIRALEDMIGVQLFRRLSRGVQPTAAGQAFVERARLILHDVDLAVEAARRTARGEIGRLAIGFTSSAAFHPVVTSAVQSLRAQAPDLTLTLEEASSVELFDAVRSGLLDAAFVRLPLHDQPGLAIRHVVDDEMLVALPADHPLAKAETVGDRLSLSSLREETFILYHRRGGPGLYDSIIAACAQAGFSPRVGQEASQITSTLSLVAAGLGLTIVPGALARLGTSGIAYRPLDQDIPLVAPLWLIWREGEGSGPLGRLLNILPKNRAGS